MSQTTSGFGLKVDLRSLEQHIFIVPMLCYETYIGFVTSMFKISIIFEMIMLHDCQRIWKTMSFPSKLYYLSSLDVSSFGIEVRLR